MSGARVVPELVVAGVGIVVLATGSLCSTVDVDGLPGDIAEHFGGEKDRGAGDLVDVTRPAQRNRLTDFGSQTLGTGPHQPFGQGEVRCYSRLR